MDAKLSVLEFTTRAIKTLRVAANQKAVAKGFRQSKGIHAVYSGFNAAFRAYFNADPVVAMKDLAAKGHIAIVPMKGGAKLLLAEDVGGEGGDSTTAQNVLNTILGASLAPALAPAAKSTKVRSAPPTRPAVASTDGQPIEEVI